MSAIDIAAIRARDAEDWRLAQDLPGVFGLNQSMRDRHDLLAEIAASQAREEALRKALEPFATTAEQLDRHNARARTQQVTFDHPAKEDADEEVPEWPLPDDFFVVHAMRYHDPVPASERIGLQMRHFRRARAALTTPGDTGLGEMRDPESGLPYEGCA